MAATRLFLDIAMSFMEKPEERQTRANVILMIPIGFDLNIILYYKTTSNSRSESWGFGVLGSIGLFRFGRNTRTF